MKPFAMSRVAARYTWAQLRVSFWFAPTVMALAGVLLAWVMYWLDGLIPNEALEESRFVLAGSAGEVRAYLLSMATTILTTAGVVFTLLTLPLSTVAAQYGSRLLRVFLGDRTTQLVLGMFVGTFVYCIAGALSIPPAAVQVESPQITATVGLLLMLATFASLVLLVQHISTMLQAPNIAAAAGAELLDVIRSESLAELGSAEDRRPTGRRQTDTLAEAEGREIRAWDSGYIEYVDPEYLLALAREKDLIVRLLCQAGDFVRSGEVVALIWPAGRVDERLERQIRRGFRLGNQRTPTQDITAAVNQLVEMAVRAMSPAINDPFTAMTCMDHLGDGLAMFVREGEKSAHFRDPDGRLCLSSRSATLDWLLGAAFDMLRHASSDNASVLLHMLDTLDVIGQETESPEARQSLLRHARLIEAESQAGRLIEEDRQSVRLRAEGLQTMLMGAQ